MRTVGVLFQFVETRISPQFLRMGVLVEKIKKILIVKKYILVWCHFKALFKYYKFCSEHFLIRPSLGRENGVEGENIQIYE